jgi:hypothetical protein
VVNCYCSTWKLIQLSKEITKIKFNKPILSSINNINTAQRIYKGFALRNTRKKPKYPFRMSQFLFGYKLLTSRSRGALWEAPYILSYLFF